MSIQQVTATRRIESENPLRESNSPTIARPIAMGEGSLEVGGVKESFTYELGKPVKGVSELTVEGLSPANQLLGMIGSAIATIMKQPATRVAATALSVGVLAEKSDAAVIRSSAMDPIHQTYGQANNDNLLWIKARSGTVDYYFSGIRLNEEYGIIPMHTFNFTTAPQQAQLLMAGTGDNYFTNPGQTTPISLVYTAPDWSASNPFGTPDIAVVRFGTPLTGPDVTIAPAGSVQEGDVLTMVGFGWPAVAGQGYYPQRDGNVRGWEMPVRDGVPGNVNPEFYVGTSFSNTTGLALNANVSAEDSGGIVLKNGMAVGMMASGTGGTGSIGSMEYLDLSDPNTASRFATYVPEPTGIVAAGAAMGVLLLRRNRRDTTQQAG